jgi:putative transposase
VPKRRRRLEGFDTKVLALYARGMTTREIQGHLGELYGVEVSPQLISTVTDAVIEDVEAWQSRPLDRFYPVVYLDAIHLKVRESRHVQTSAVYIALAINAEGHKELLGFSVDQAEGAKFWLSILTELENRGVTGGALKLTAIDTDFLTHPARRQRPSLAAAALAAALSAKCPAPPRARCGQGPRVARG